MRKLLIADASEEFRSELAENLKAAYMVHECGNGHQALQTLHSLKPDILVLDLMLPGLDGISLLQEAAEEGLQPMVLATTRFVNDYVLDAAERLGVGYVMVKPCEVRATVSRIADLTQRLKSPSVSRPDPRTLVSNVLLSLSVPTKLKGYACLREAILEAMRDPTQQLTKELYPKVGQRCDGNGVQVERAIRSAIKAAWNRREERIWRLYFRPNMEGILERPTNASFILCIANRMSMDQGSARQEIFW